MSREINFLDPSAKDRAYMEHRPWLLDEVGRLAEEPPEEEVIDLGAMTVPELRDLCDEYDLDSTGKKSELIDRLLGYLNSEAPEDAGEGSEEGEMG